MMRPFKLLLATVAVAGLATLPTMSQAQGSKSESASSKSAAASGSKNPSAVDEFEENRRAHVQKSKENNANKGAN